MDPTPTSELVEHLVEFYEAVAEEYEAWASNLHRKVAERLAEFIEPRPGECVLDVGTGTGLVAHFLAARVGDEGLVVGIDLSERMLEVARRRGGSNSRFIGMAAENLVFRDETFDVVTMGESLAYLLDPLRSLREARRVLKPGGRIGVSCHRRSLNTEAQEVFFSTLGPLARRHHLHLPRYSDERAVFGEREVLPGLLEQAGFTDVKLTELVTGGRAPDARAWTQLMAGAGPLPHTLISVLGPEPRREYEEELDARMRQLGEDAYRYHHAFVFAMGRRPLEGAGGEGAGRNGEGPESHPLANGGPPD